MILTAITQRIPLFGTKERKKYWSSSLERLTGTSEIEVFIQYCSLCLITLGAPLTQDWGNISFLSSDTIQCYWQGIFVQVSCILGHIVASNLTDTLIVSYNYLGPVTTPTHVF